MQAVNVLDLTRGLADGNAANIPRSQGRVVTVERHFRGIGSINALDGVAVPGEDAQREDHVTLIGGQHAALDQVRVRLTAGAVVGEKIGDVAQLALFEASGADE